MRAVVRPDPDTGVLLCPRPLRSRASVSLRPAGAVRSIDADMVSPISREGRGKDRRGRPGRPCAGCTTAEVPRAVEKSGSPVRPYAWGEGTGRWLLTDDVLRWGSGYSLEAPRCRSAA